MQIKLRGHLYDSTIEPIMIILSPQDKLNISRMPDECTKYAEFPNDQPPTIDEMLEWMDEPTPKARKQRKTKKETEKETHR